MFSSGSKRLTGRDDIRKILVIRWSAMGDVALASAGFEELHRAFPSAVLHLNTLPPWDGLFRSDPRFSHVWAIPLRDRSAQWRRMFQWLRSIRRERYDLIVDFQCSDRARLLLSLLWLSGGGARFRVGNAPGFPYNIAPTRIPEPVHALTRIQRLLEAMGISPSVDKPVLHPSADDRDAAARKLDALNLRPGRYAVLLPGSQVVGYLKRWGAERFARLADQLVAGPLWGDDLADGGSRGTSTREASEPLDALLVLGGADEVDECQRIADVARVPVHNLCGQTGLLELIPLCAGARFIVANDTGTAHVAAATGRPMLVICGPTDPRMVVPAGPEVRWIQARLDCINCYRKHCEHHSCMRLLRPEEIANRLRWMSGAAVSDLDALGDSDYQMGVSGRPSRRG
ncbi:MAG: glycosyltransferase family 9 protein [Gammaproteobacteria bacterium]|nr:glycosyltransferase family 9 protein [Gammaproteobacteria bacterium]